MAALTKDRNTTQKIGGQLVLGVAANAKIYAGAAVCVDANGYAIPGANNAGLKFVGVAQEQVDNTGGANGNKTVLVKDDGVFDFAGAGFVTADVGKPVFLSDDQTVALTTTNSVSCGVIREVESATKVWVDIRAGGRRAGAAQADSVAADAATLRGDFNSLLAKLRAAGLIGS